MPGCVRMCMTAAAGKVQWRKVCRVHLVQSWSTDLLVRRLELPWQPQSGACAEHCRYTGLPGMALCCIDLCSLPALAGLAVLCPVCPVPGRTGVLLPKQCLHTIVGSPGRGAVTHPRVRPAKVLSCQAAQQYTWSCRLSGNSSLSWQGSTHSLQ